MKIEKIAIADNIFLLVFENQFDITSTFLRFQEHYESPEFHGKIFTLDEYKQWYAKEKGSFSYYSDWSGFNIPSYILKPFREGKFDPLSEKEKQLLSLFGNENGKFYVIGIHCASEKTKNTLTHEIAHALYYVNDAYRREVDEVMKEYDVEELKKELASMAGYADEVLDDEVQAYAIDSSKKMKTKIPKELSENSREIFGRYSRNIKIEM